MQTLADAWKERSADPWTTKTLRQNSQPGVKAVVPPRQDLVAYVGPSPPVEPPIVTAALLEALQGLCCQPSGKQEVSYKPPERCVTAPVLRLACCLEGTCHPCQRSGCLEVYI